MMQVPSVRILPDRHALTDEPYRNMFSAELLPKIAAAPMIGIPVPMKKLAPMDIPKYLLNTTFRKV